MSAFNEMISKYGPGLIYGKDTIQSFIDELVMNSYSHLQNEFAFVLNSHQGERKIEIEELQELEEIRGFILAKYFSQLIPKYFPKYPIIKQLVLPKIESPGLMLKSVFIPVISKITAARTDSIPKIINSLLRILSGATPEGAWDIPDISNEIVKWMTQVYQSQITPSEYISSLLQLWIKFFSIHCRIEDIFALAAVWFCRSLENINLPSIEPVTSFERSPRARFSKFTSVASITRMNLHQLNCVKINPPKDFKSLPYRICTADSGFLYICDNEKGLFKFGTGAYGTIFGSNVKSSEFYKDKSPTCMTIFQGNILIHSSNNVDIINVLHPYSFIIIRTLKFPNFDLNHALFTAFGDFLYVATQTTLYTYRYEGQLIPITNIPLQFPEDVDFLKEHVAQSSMITNGDVICFYYYTNNFDLQSIEFEIETGKMLPSISPENRINTSCIAYDQKTQYLICATPWEHVTLIHLPENYVIYKQFNENTSTTGNIPYDIFNYLLPEYLITYSLENLNLNNKFLILSAEPILKLIDIMNENKVYLFFAKHAVLMLSLFYHQNEQQPLPSFGQIQHILRYSCLNSNHKIFFMHSLLKRGAVEPFNKFGSCVEILDRFRPEEIIKLFSSTFYNNVYFALAILYQKNHAILDCASHNSLTAYPFISSITNVLLYGINGSMTILPYVAVPFIDAISKCDPMTYPTILPPVLPILQKLLDSDISFNSIYDSLMVIMEKINNNCSTSINLTQFAKEHEQNRSNQNLIKVKKYDETDHPYQNDTDYVHIFDFSGAISVEIEFDPQTDSEAGCDTLQIFTDAALKNPLTQKMSGPFTNWKSPIQTNAQSLYFQFHSDGSVASWGYKATITASYANISTYLSPNPYFDISHVMYMDLLKVGRRFHQYPNFTKEYPKFVFPEVPSRKYMLDEEIQQLCQKVSSEYPLLEYKELLAVINTGVLTAPYYLKHLFENKMLDGVILNVLQTVLVLPERFLTNYPPKSQELFSKLASYLVQSAYIPEETYSFLLVAIKGTDNGFTFAKNTLEFAKVAVDNELITPENLVHTAIKIQKAVQIGGDQVAPEALVIFEKFLDSFSQLTLPITSSISINLVEKASSLFDNMIPFISNMPEFLTRVSQILSKITVNQPDNTVPFVDFALKAALSVDNKTEYIDMLIKIVIRSILFKIPSIFNTINTIIDKFHFKTKLSDSPEIARVFEMIGEGFKLREPAKEAMFNIGPNFAISQAAILRRIIDPDSIHELIPIIEKDDESTFGTLTVLSLRFMPPYQHQKVRLTKDGSVATIESMDPLYYHLVSESGIKFTVPVIDSLTFECNSIPFEVIKPPPYQKITPELVDAVFKSTAGKYADKALFVLSEFSITTTIKQFETIRNNLKKPNHSVKEPRLLLDTNSYFSIPIEKAKLYRSNVVSDTFSITVNCLPMHIGLVSMDDPTNYHSFDLAISKTKSLSISDDQTIFTQKLTKDTITIGVIGSWKQVFVLYDEAFVLTNIYLSPYSNLSPYVISESVPIGFNIHPPIPLYLSPSPRSRPNKFTHASLGSSLVKIGSNFYPMSQQYNRIHLMPALSSQIPCSYLEINCEADVVNFMVIHELFASYVLYSVEIPNVVQTNTYGLFINPVKKYVFVTRNGEIMKETLVNIEMFSAFSVIFSTSNARSISLNTGQYPYIFNVDSFLHDTSFEIPENEAKIDINKKLLPCGLKSLFLSAEIPQFMSTKTIDEFKIDFNKERPVLVNTTNCNQYQFLTCLHTMKPEPKVSLVSNISTTLELKNNEYSSTLDNMLEGIKLSEAKTRFIIAYDRIQRSFPSFVHPLFYFPYSTTNDHLLSPSRHQQYIEGMEETVFNTMSLYNSMHTNNITIEQILQYTRVLGTNDLSGLPCDSVIPLFNYIFEKKSDLLRPLVKIALNDLAKNWEREDVTITSSVKNVFIEFDRKGADAISLQVCEPTCNINSPISVFSSDLKIKYDIYNNDYSCGNTTIPGELILFKNIVQSSGIIFLKVLPIYFNNSNNNLRFALQFISYLVQICDKNEEVLMLLHNEILIPIFKLIMEDNPLIFSKTYAEWFASLLKRKLIPISVRKKYVDEINMYSIVNFNDPDLAISLTLFSFYVTTNIDDDLVGVRERTVKFIDAIYSKIYDQIDERGSDKIIFNPYILVINRIIYDLMSPYGNKLQCLGAVGDLALPVITSMSYKIFGLSKFHNKCTVLRSDEMTSQTTKFKFSDEKAAYYYISFSDVPPQTFFTVDEGTPQLVQPGIIHSNSISFSIHISVPHNQNPISVSIYPVEEKIMANIFDVTSIVRIHHELAEKLTPADDSMMCGIAVALKGITTISMFNDQYFAKLFPHISPEASRFRVQTHLLFNFFHVSARGVNTPSLKHFARFCQSISIYNGVSDSHKKRNCQPLHVASSSSLSSFYNALEDTLSFVHPYILKNKISTIKSIQSQQPRKIKTNLRACTNNLFIQGNGTSSGMAAFLPNRSAMTNHEIRAYIGFGRHLVNSWRSNSALPFPISRVVIRYAFGGKIRVDDFEDCDIQFYSSHPTDEQIQAYIKPFLLQLEAIKEGVRQYIDFWCPMLVADEDMFPRVVQLLPAKAKKIESEKQIPFVQFYHVFAPHIRKDIFQKQATLLAEEKLKEYLVGLYKNLAESIEGSE